MPVEASDPVLRLFARASSFEASYARSNDLEALDEAIRTLRMALRRSTDDHSLRAVVLSLLATLLRARYEHTGKSEDLVDAMGVARRSLDLATDDPLRPGILGVLADVLHTWAHHAEDRAALDEAVILNRQAVELATDHSTRSLLLSTLSAKLGTLFDLTGDHEALEEAIELGRRSVERSDAVDRPQRLANLSRKLLVRYEHTGGTASLDEAVRVSEQAVDLVPDGQPDNPWVLANLAQVRRIRSHHGGAPEDLDHAIGLLERAVELTPPGHRRRAERQLELAAALRDRAERSMDPTETRRSISLYRELLRGAGSRPVDRRVATGLAAALLALYRGTGDEAALEEALRLSRQAVDADGGDDPICLSRLGGTLQFRGELTGDVSDLEEAVDLFERVLSLGSERAVDRGGDLVNFVSALRLLYDVTGDLATLDRAIHMARRAVEATSEGDPIHVAALSFLGAGLRARHDRTGDRRNLREAVDVGHRSVTAVAPDAILLNAYANTLQAWYEVTQDEEALAEAVRIGREAVAATSDGDANLSLYLTNLANSLRLAFKRSGDEDTVREAVAASRRAVEATPRDHPRRAGILYNLGGALALWHKATGELPLLFNTMQAFEEAAAIDTAAPTTRLSATAMGGVAAAESGRWERADRFFTQAVGLLARAAPRALDRPDQEHALGAFPGLVSTAASAAVGKDPPDPAHAVELVEQGRGVLISQALETRTADLAGLHDQWPALAAKFEELRDRLDDARTAGLTPANPRAPDGQQRVAHHRRRLVTEWDDLVAAIRERPGWESFLAPPSIDRLCAQAVDGPIAIVSLSRYRGDAFVLTSAGVQLVPLPDLSMEWAVERAAAFFSQPGRAARPDDVQLGRILADLWDVVAGPVLDAVGLVGPDAPLTPWPRLWWLPVGIVNLLPLHAAGHHGDGSGSPPRTVLDRAVSSYTPTIRALEHSRSRRLSDAAGADDRTLVVAMPHTPGASDLPGTAREAELLAQRLPRVLRLDEQHATRDRVSTELPRHAVAHFACHATTVPDRPSHSHLRLHDGSLTVLDLEAYNLDAAHLAYLSACSTARTALPLVDEAVHVSTALQVAGYQHVIGTLWPIRDRAAVEMADAFYANLTDTDGTLDTSRAATALHHAVRGLRSRHPLHPTHWASHIHVGP